MSATTVQNVGYSAEVFIDDATRDAMEWSRRQWFKQFTAKWLARRYGVSVRTAETWKAGARPSWDHLEEMVDDWGDTFLRSIFRQVLEETDTELAARLARVTLELAEIQKIQEKRERAARRVEENSLRGSGALAGQAGRTVREGRAALSRKVGHLALTLAALCVVAGTQFAALELYQGPDLRRPVSRTYRPNVSRSVQMRGAREVA